jgi:hypothetical protein
MQILSQFKNLLQPPFLGKPAIPWPSLILSTAHSTNQSTFLAPHAQTDQTLPWASPSVYKDPDHPSLTILAHYTPLTSLYHSQSPHSSPHLILPWRASSSFRCCKLARRIATDPNLLCLSPKYHMNSLFQIYLTMPLYSCRSSQSRHCHLAPICTVADGVDPPELKSPRQSHPQGRPELRICSTTSPPAGCNPRWAAAIAYPRLGFPPWYSWSEVGDEGGPSILFRSYGRPRPVPIRPLGPLTGGPHLSDGLIVSSRPCGRRSGPARL